MLLASIGEVESYLGNTSLVKPTWANLKSSRSVCFYNSFIPSGFWKDLAN